MKRGKIVLGALLTRRAGIFIFRGYMGLARMKLVTEL